MKGRWKWVFLVTGVLLISATCGFGYEQKATRTQFEEAKDAFEHRDWDRLAENLSYKNYPHSPREKAFAAFLKSYVDPLLDQGKYQLVSREWASSMVPIPNDEVAYTRTFADGKSYKFLQLQYIDDVVWIPVPTQARQVGIFQGKQVTLSFYVTFYRVAYTLFPPHRHENRNRSIVEFVKRDKEKLAAMGIFPRHLYSKVKTWDEFLRTMETSSRDRS